MTMKDEAEGRNKLTNDNENDLIGHRDGKGISLAEIDPRIIELVRFLARTAAERDYAEFIANIGGDKEANTEKEALQ